MPELIQMQCLALTTPCKFLFYFIFLFYSAGFKALFKEFTWFQKINAKVDAGNLLTYPSVVQLKNVPRLNTLCKIKWYFFHFRDGSAHHQRSKRHQQQKYQRAMRENAAINGDTKDQPMIPKQYDRPLSNFVCIF